MENTEDHLQKMPDGHLRHLHDAKLRQHREGETGSLLNDIAMNESSTGQAA